jgi:hypothetical protein
MIGRHDADSLVISAAGCIALMLDDWLIDPRLIGSSACSLHVVKFASYGFLIMSLLQHVIHH